jgi:hypothetical protein
MPIVPDNHDYTKSIRQRMPRRLQELREVANANALISELRR